MTIPRGSYKDDLSGKTKFVNKFKRGSSSEISKKLISLLKKKIAVDMPDGIPSWYDASKYILDGVTNRLYARSRYYNARGGFA